MITVPWGIAVFVVNQTEISVYKQDTILLSLPVFYRIRVSELI